MQGEGPENSIFGHFSSIELVSSKTEKQSDKVNEILEIIPLLTNQKKKQKLYIYRGKLLRKMCPYSELLWSVFSGIRTEYGEIWSICPYSVRMRENTDHFSCSECYAKFLK